jgi:hypothetical protein
MITYSRIGAKVWRQVSHFGPVLARDLRSEELESVDQELLQWYEQIPEEVKVRNWDKEKQITSTPSYNLQRLRIWTYLRLNQVSWKRRVEVHVADSSRCGSGYIHQCYIAQQASWRIRRNQSAWWTSPRIRFDISTT